MHNILHGQHQRYLDNLNMPPTDWFSFHVHVFIQYSVAANMHAMHNSPARLFFDMLLFLPWTLKRLCMKATQLCACVCERGWFCWDQSCCSKYQCQWYRPFTPQLSFQHTALEFEHLCVSSSSTWHDFELLVVILFSTTLRVCWFNAQLRKPTLKVSNAG